MSTDIKTAFNSISHIPEEDWEKFEPYLKTREIKKNQYYLREGEIEQQISYIVSGSFRWYYINDKGQEVNYHFFFDGSFLVDYLSLITQQPSRMYLQAMEDSVIILLPKRNKILDFYAESHSWERFGRIVAESVYAETANRAHDFLFRTAEERYRILLRQRPNIFQRVSLSHISSYLGMQGPSLSRIRKRISKE
jgi:CRP-like cAMP-binding protein